MDQFCALLTFILFFSTATIAIATGVETNFNQPNVCTDTASQPVTKSKPNPKTAVRLAILPGAGQLYNRDFWKAPIVYLALGGSIFTHHLNSLKYHDFLRAYKLFYDLGTGQPAQGVTADTKMPVKVRNLLNTGSSVELLSKDQIVRQKNIWRRYRNLSVFTTGIIYVLSIIEANVAAHLKGFDLSDDLSFRIMPDLLPSMAGKSSFGLQLVVSFR
jgi:hypothetical protein